MGYGPHRPARASLERVVDRICVQASKSVRPLAVYQQLKVARWSAAGQALEIEGSRRFRGGTFLHHIRNCKTVVVFVLSLGTSFEQLQQTFREAQEALEGYILDTAGWWGVENFTSQLKRHLAGELAAQGMELTRRVGPGYIFQHPKGQAMWPLEDQAVLFSCFDDVDHIRMPASLVEGTYTMRPQMSRSGLFGAKPICA